MTMYQKSVETSHEGKITIVWNQQVRTDRIIPNDKLENIIRHNKKGTCMLIDVAIHGDRSVINKEDEKILKSKDPHNRKSAHGECESKNDTVILGATGTISKSLRQYLSNTPGKHEIK